MVILFPLKRTPLYAYARKTGVIEYQTDDMEQHCIAPMRQKIFVLKRKKSVFGRNKIYFISATLPT